MTASGRDRLPFDEAFLSGFIDGELTQAEEQRVRIRLETDPEARRLVEELRATREAAAATVFAVPRDLQAAESPRGLLSTLLRRGGWLLLGAWLAGVVTVGLWRLVTSPEQIAPKLLLVGGLLGITLLFLSVLYDRVRDRRTDRYRRVRQ